MTPVPTREASEGRDILEAAVQGALAALQQYPATPHVEIVKAVGDILDEDLVHPNEDYEEFLCELYARLEP